MQAIANLIVSAIDLLELEGRALHRGMLRLAWKLLALIGAGILGLAGLCLLARALYLLIERGLGPIGAAAGVGIVMVATAFGLFLYARSLPMRLSSVAGAETRSPEQQSIDSAMARAEADLPPRQPPTSSPTGAGHAATVP